MDVIDRVTRFIREHDLARPGSRIVAAVSGGSDSVALAHLLAELDRSAVVRLAGLVHFNHQLRASADADEQFVRDLADALGYPLLADREDVAARAARDHQSIEHAARTARYEGFARARDHFGGGDIALGHTADDQAETLLLRLVRGAGPRGLAGMHPRNGWVVRPLLGVRRAELREWLRARGAVWVEDETNADASIPRNRIRAELLPLLESRFNPNIVEVLAGEAELAQTIWAWMKAECEAFGPDLDVARLQAASPALRSLVLWRAMNAAAGGRPVGFDHVRAALRLIDTGDGAVDVPGHRVQRIAGKIVLTERGAQGSHRANFFRYVLSIPGEVALPGCTVSVEIVTSSAMPDADRATAGNGPVAIVNRDRVQGSLAVRNRRAGDRFRPVGLGGSKKLQDLFVDRKVARHERDDVPLVVDETDRIVWVAGYGIDEAFRVSDPSQGVLVLRLTRYLGGSA